MQACVDCNAIRENSGHVLKATAMRTLLMSAKCRFRLNVVFPRFRRYVLGSGKPLPSGLTRDAQRTSNLRPTHLSRSKDLNHLLELIALALDRVLNCLKALQQTFRRTLLR